MLIGGFAKVEEPRQVVEVGRKRGGETSSLNEAMSDPAGIRGKASLCALLPSNNQEGPQFFLRRGGRRDINCSPRKCDRYQRTCTCFVGPAPTLNRPQAPQKKSVFLRNLRVSTLRNDKQWIYQIWTPKEIRMAGGVEISFGPIIPSPLPKSLQKNPCNPGKSIHVSS